MIISKKRRWEKSEVEVLGEIAFLKWIPGILSCGLLVTVTPFLISYIRVMGLFGNGIAYPSTPIRQNLTFPIFKTENGPWESDSCRQKISPLA